MQYHKNHDCSGMEEHMSAEMAEEMSYGDEEEAMAMAEEMGMDAYHRHRRDGKRMHVPGKNCYELSSCMDDHSEMEHDHMEHHDEDEEMAADMEGVIEQLTVYQG